LLSLNTLIFIQLKKTIVSVILLDISIQAKNKVGSQHYIDSQKILIGLIIT